MMLPPPCDGQRRSQTFPVTGELSTPVVGQACCEAAIVAQNQQAEMGAARRTPLLPSALSENSRRALLSTWRRVASAVLSLRIFLLYETASGPKSDLLCFCFLK